MDRPISILVVASFFKGVRFIEECRKEGVDVYLLTRLSLKDAGWHFDDLKDVFYLPEFSNREDVLKAVAYLARTREFDRIVPMDDYDVELASYLRENLRIPGMGDTTARYFRDKLAMRVKARDENIPCPRFEHVLNHNRLNRFMEEVPGPWVMKPRSLAGAIGIKKIYEPRELWEWVEKLGDDQTNRLLEEFVVGPVFHVDSIVWADEIVFSHAAQYVKPPFEIWNYGGIFGTESVPENTELYAKLMERNQQVIKAMGLKRGVTHAEYILSEKNNEVYFLEIASRVGGASIDMMVEAASGLNMWVEWAKLEIADIKKEEYVVPERKHNCSALLVSLSRQAEPDLSSYNDPEVWWQMKKDHHAGIVITSPDHERIDALVQEYIKRFAQDFMAVEPPSEVALT